MAERPQFHCYLLRSVKTERSTRCYIGFTTHPQRRIRQHNGEIKSGAKKTSSHRPWKYILIVSGFPNKIVALQFEWQFQHPLESRIVRDRISIHRKWSQGWKGKLEILAVMTEIGLWSQLHLRIHFLDASAYSWFKASFPYNPTWIQLIGSVGDLPLPLPPVRILAERSRCSICSKASGAQWKCECDAVTHLVCTALQRSTESSSLLPATGSCPVCRRCFQWSDIVSRSTGASPLCEENDSSGGSDCSEEEAAEEQGRDGNDEEQTAAKDDIDPSYS
jgi:structure-specific endonuclease subunit SLX1